MTILAPPQLTALMPGLADSASLVPASIDAPSTRAMMSTSSEQLVETLAAPALNALDLLTADFALTAPASTDASTNSTSQSEPLPAVMPALHHLTVPRLVIADSALKALASTDARQARRR